MITCGNAKRSLIQTIFLLVAFVMFPTSLCNAAPGNDDWLSPSTYNYNVRPLVPTDTSMSVGTIATNTGVSLMGTAVCEIGIETPSGPSGVKPQISLAYGLSSAGIAGFGFSISGLSSITRGTKDIFHNGKAEGVSYTDSDVFFLDGKRLIPASTSTNAKIYHPEGDISTTVYLEHDASMPDVLKFRVKGADGITAYFGSSQAARNDYAAPDGSVLTSVWKIDKSIDRCGNIINYQYRRDRLHLYPSIIEYGENINTSHFEKKRIEFSYLTLPDLESMPYKLGGKQAYIGLLLNSITTKAGNSVYRTYSLEYDNAVCKDGQKRLCKVTVCNGNGERLKPTLIEWNPVEPNLTASKIDIRLMEETRDLELEDRMYVSMDVTSNGYDDIVEIVNANEKNNPDNKSHYYTYLNIYKNITEKEDTCTKFILRKTLKCSPNVGGTWTTYSEMPTVIDYDGDGLSDIVVPSKYNIYSDNGMSWMIYPGASLKEFSDECILINILTHCNGTRNIYSYGDFNKDGRTDILQMEQDAVNRQYYCHLIRHRDTGNPNAEVSTTFSLNLPSEPKRLFVADYDNNGMEDLLVVCKNNYRIFWNTNDSIPFSNSGYITGYNVSDVTNMCAGDFNGDGIPDLLTNKEGESNYYIAFSNGDGTFTVELACTPSVSKDNPDKDNVRYTMLVSDFNHDGRSDVFVAKANKYHTGRNDVVWLYSKNNKLEEKQHLQTFSEDDSKWFKTIVGNFSGKGAPEIIHFGSNILTPHFGDVNHIYYDANWSVGSGLISSVIDGMDNLTRFSYSNLSDKSIYSCSKSGNWPIVNVFAPMIVVSAMAKSNGVAGGYSETYSYANLQIETTGKGLLPFEKIVSTNNLTEVTTTTEIKKVDPNFLIPTKTLVTIEGNGWKESEQSEYLILAKDDRNFMQLLKKKTETDPDGYSVSTENDYDTDYGYVLSTGVYHDNEYIYNITDYGEYNFYEGTWLPSAITERAKHPDDTKEFKTKTQIEYTEAGLPIRTTTLAGTDKQVVRTRSFDIWGNIISERVEAYGANTITTYSDYDSTGLHRMRMYTVPESSAHLYTYDLWGNLLTDTDATNAACPLTTENGYDNWGNLIYTKNPRGAVAAKYMVRNNNESGYNVVEMGHGMPWKVTCYDEKGRKIKEQGIGIGDVVTTKTYSFDKFGNIVSTNVANGQLVYSDSIKYDNRNRVVKQWDSFGNQKTYSYVNRTVRTNVNGRRNTTTYNAWGDVKSVQDPLCIVTNKYYSNGKVSKSGVSPLFTAMEYDVAGNVVRLVDPDAGTTTYEYNALGNLVSQTDAKGVETVHVYDSLNRLVAVNIDGVSTNYIYGTEGNSKNLPIREETGNMVEEREYNEYGEIIEEARIIDGKKFVSTLEYDSLGRVSRKTFPNGICISYDYDCYGNHIQSRKDTACVWRFLSTDGIQTRERIGSAYFRTTTLDSYGHLADISLRHGNSIVHEMTFDFNPQTGNLMSRTGMDQWGTQEQFTYDNLDRLISWTEQQGHCICNIEYDKYGRIKYKSGVGDYETGRGHQVSLVTNEIDSIPGYPQAISYNGFGKVTRLSGLNGTFDIFYGPDMERWMEKDSRKQSVIYFFDNYEHIELESDFLDICYLDGGAMYIKTRQYEGVYCPFTDNLGSYIKIFSPTGEEVFHTTYDAWGKPTCIKNDIGFIRGYGGHEMMDNGWLVNMNGRIYDPWLAVFLSPDNYIQNPLNSQNYNRYSYCVNNPLKYTDPSGNFFGLEIFAMFSVLNIAGSMMQAAVMGQNVWKAAAGSVLSSAVSFGIGQLSSMASFGIGQLFGPVAGVGHEVLRAGAHGVAGGLLNLISGQSFSDGFLVSSLASGVGSGFQSMGVGTDAVLGATTVTGGLAAWASGGDIVSGAMRGMSIGALNHALHDSKNVMGCSAECEKLMAGFYNAPEDLDQVNVLGKFISSKPYSLSNSTKISLVSSSIGYTKKLWENTKTATKSRIVYNTRKYLENNYGYRIAANNSTLYNKVIPNKLYRWSRATGYAGALVCGYENISDIINSGSVGLGNVVDMSLSAVGLIPAFGNIVTFGYLGADYLWYQYSGFTINQSLNNVYSVKIPQP